MNAALVDAETVRVLSAANLHKVPPTKITNDAFKAVMNGKSNEAVADATVEAIMAGEGSQSHIDAFRSRTAREASRMMRPRWSFRDGLLAGTGLAGVFHSRAGIKLSPTRRMRR